MIDSERFDFYGKLLCGKWQEKCKGIAIGFYRLQTASFDMGQVVVEKLKYTAFKFHKSFR